jgi:hypothetical protein
MSIDTIPKRYSSTENGDLYLPKDLNPEYFEAKRQQIGKTKLEEVELGGKLKPKEHLTEDDMREVAVAQIDEMDLDLAGENQSSRAVRKSRNDLRDMKDVITKTERSHDESWYAALSRRAAQLEGEGNRYEAEVARSAAELLARVQDEADKGIGYGDAHDPRQAARFTRDLIRAHNDRVENNLRRPQAL